jgi:hypothetical protein
MGKICYRTLLFSHVCQNTLLNYGFAEYHYNFVSHLPEHTALPKKGKFHHFLGMTIL